MNNAERIVQFALQTLDPILDRSGYVLYSAASSLQWCPVYLLGHNPGGSPDDQPTNTVRASLADLPTKTINNYLDEAWTMPGGRSFSNGQAPLQRRVVWLLQQLGLSPRKVPASNLIFSRSVNVANSGFSELADLCWSVHEQVLKIACPRLLLVFGNSDPSPYTYLYAKFQPGREHTCESGHGKWQCRGFETEEGLTVIGLPHLSRYNVIGKTDVVQWIRELGDV